jgi:hypothetical protein
MAGKEVHREDRSQKEDQVTGRVDLFFRTAPRDGVREAIAIACLRRWRSDPLVRVRVIGPSEIVTSKELQPMEIGLPEENFHFASRQYADEHAETEPYFIVDDDEMPLGADWVERAVKLWRIYNADRKYVMMVARSMLTVEDPVRHHERLRTSKLEVEEMPYWWGCPYMSYQGVVPYEEMKGRAEQQDPIVADWARANDKKQALMMNLYYSHFGLSFSQIQPALYGRF